jgi:hypothetical protein
MDAAKAREGSVNMLRLIYTLLMFAWALLFWHRHERRVLLSVRCDGGEPGA